METIYSADGITPIMRVDDKGYITFTGRLFREDGGWDFVETGPNGTKITKGAPAPLYLTKAKFN